MMSEEQPAGAFESILRLLARLESHGYRYWIEHPGADALSIRIDVPGEHWSVQVDASGQVELEAFTSTGSVASGSQAEDMLERLFDATGSDA